MKAPLFKWGAVALAYTLTSWLVQVYFSSETRGSILFLASGLALAATLLGGRHGVWAIFIGALLASALTNKFHWASVVMAGGAALGAFIGAWLLRLSGRFDDRLGTLPDFMRLLLLGGLVGSSVSALLGTGCLQWQGFVPEGRFFASAVDWWLGDVQGVVLLTPLLLLWRPNPDRPYGWPSVRYLVEAGLVFGWTVFTSGIVFLDWGRHWFEAYPELFPHSVFKAYWMFVYATWIAVRQGLRATSLALLLVAGMAATGVHQGVGYFSHDGTSGLIANWFFTLCLSVVGMALAIYIHDHKRLSEALAKSGAATSQELRNVLTALNQHALVVLIDADGRITSANDKFCQISGYTQDELRQGDRHLLRTKLHEPDFYQTLYDTVASGNVWHSDISRRAKDGRIFWLDSTVAPIKNAADGPSVYVSICADITQRKKIEDEQAWHRSHLEQLVLQKTEHLQQALQALQVSEEKHRMLLEESSDPIFSVTPELRYSYVNTAFAAPLGKSPQEIIGKGPHDCFPKVEADKRVSGLRSIFDSGRVRNFEVRVPGTSGEQFYLTTVRPIFDAAHQVIAVLGISKDITERKLAEQKLNQTLSLLSATLEAIDEGVIVMGRDAHIDRWNQRFVMLWGIDEDLLIAQNLRQCREHMASRMIDPQAYLSNLADWSASPEATGSEFISLVDGRILKRSFRPQYLGDQEVGRVWSFVDVTQLERQKEALLKSETRFTLAVEGADEGIWDLNLLTQELYHSPRMAEILGYTLAELPSVREVWDALAHPDDVGQYRNKMLAHFKDANQPFETNIRLRHKDGSWRWILSRGRASRNAAGRAIRFTGTHTDLTERKRIEEAAQAATQAKSEFLANMSHEIRTPMNGVVGMVDILQQTQLDPEQRRMVEVIHHSAEALLGILNDILDYSKIEAGKLAVEHSPTLLRQVCESVIQLMVPAATAKAIELGVFVSPQLPLWILIDPTRLRQVLLNLIGNAVKFTSGTADSPGRVVLHVAPGTLAAGQPGVNLCIMDNGIGMTDAVMAKLFMPFTQADASTARQFGGTGLGLSISQNLAELMGGQISVRSAPDQGSEFTLALPLRVAQSCPNGSSEPRLDGVQVVSLTQDDLTWEIISGYCTAAGAQVMLASDLTHALSLVQQEQGQFKHAVLLLGQAYTAPADALPLPAGVGVLCLVRRESSLMDQGITVLTQPLLQLDLLTGVAMAAGLVNAHEVVALSDQRQQARVNAPTVAQARADGSLILLAEDNETNRDVLQEQLCLLGYAAEVAQDGAEALAMWRVGGYALLLTDCHMPNMDGFELTRRIRAEEPAGTHLPIVAVTANALQGEALRCRENGMDDYLTKPLRLNELGPMLAKWLQRASHQRQQAVLPSDPDSAQDRQVPPLPLDLISPVPVVGVSLLQDLAIWDAAMLGQLVGNNPAMQLRLLSKFLPQAANQVNDIAAALERTDLAQASNVAHALKSAARTVGAMALGQACQQLEQLGRAGDGPACSALMGTLTQTFASAQGQIRAHLESPSR